ncbi:hypothetical protein PRZ48_002843 [Zasmidium cellare]|uniref:Xylanolytic transcriptional activator regulatory domain-containing protein n=1 Tax=Zasmidium cellare TaxID=395010 RepID=A0ABR0EUD5_ZASCE|nr:hypothetical protein PRZ48_002843 [Zasmidium cellare]
MEAAVGTVPTVSLGNAVSYASLDQQLSAAAQEVDYQPALAPNDAERSDRLNQGDPSFATLVTEAIRLVEPVKTIALEASMPSAGPSHGLAYIERELLALCNQDMHFFINQYFDSVGYVYPLVSRVACIEALNHALHAESQGAPASAAHAPGENLVLVCLVVSLGIINSPSSQRASPVVQQLMETSMSLLPTYTVDTADTEAVRCLAMAAIFGMYNFQEVASWHFLGLAMTRAISAGMHRQREYDGMDDHDSARVFWTLYKLDRDAAFALGLPVGIQDQDITDKMPQKGHPGGNGPRGPQSSFIWSLHYFEMLASWRHGPSQSLQERYSTCEYWRETYNELTAGLANPGVVKANANLRATAVLSLHEQRLACRALVYLLILAIRETKLNPTCQFIYNAVRDDVPLLMTAFKNSFDTLDIAPTVLDAYDILGDIIAYVCAQQKLQNMEAGPGHAKVVRLGISDMKVVHLAMDNLQRIARRWEPAADLPELLWCFLSALEKRAESYHRPLTEGDVSPSQILQEGMETCRLTLPEYAIELMTTALQ